MEKEEEKKTCYVDFSTRQFPVTIVADVVDNMLLFSELIACILDANKAKKIM
jgi:hypothetical protein